MNYTHTVLSGQATANFGMVYDDQSDIWNFSRHNTSASETPSDNPGLPANQGDNWECNTTGSFPVSPEPSSHHTSHPSSDMFGSTDTQPTQLSSIPPVVGPPTFALNRELTTHLTWDQPEWDFGSVVVPISDKAIARQLNYWKNMFPDGWGKVLTSAARQGFFALVDYGPRHLSEMSINTLLLVAVDIFYSEHGTCPQGVMS